MPGSWVLLSYRMPREPCTPRISIRRKLKRLGVAQLSDGLVALPADARTREHLDWIANEVTEAGDTASLWVTRPATLATEREMAETARLSLARRLRAGLRRIKRRDYFPPDERNVATEALTTMVVPEPTEQRT